MIPPGNLSWIMAKIEGMDEVLRNLQAAEDGIMKATAAGMDFALRDTVNHIKTAYSRPRTGKGFADRTTNLRNSINKAQEILTMMVIGWIFATMPYASHVELRHEGMYAYLWPGTKDKEKDILNNISRFIKLFLH